MRTRAHHTGSNQGNGVGLAGPEDTIVDISASGVKGWLDYSAFRPRTRDTGLVRNHGWQFCGRTTRAKHPSNKQNPNRLIRAHTTEHHGRTHRTTQITCAQFGEANKSGGPPPCAAPSPCRGVWSQWLVMSLRADPRGSGGVENVDVVRKARKANLGG